MSRRPVVANRRARGGREVDRDAARGRRTRLSPGRYRRLVSRGCPGGPARGRFLGRGRARSVSWLISWSKSARSSSAIRNRAALPLSCVGEDVSSAIRTPDVSLRREQGFGRARGARRTARHAAPSRRGRRRGARRPDIGTVVFPDAEAKFFLTASVDIRARRRYDELVSRGAKPELGEVIARGRRARSAR